MYWTPPSDHWTPLLKSDDLLEPRDIGPPPFKNPGHAPELAYKLNMKKIEVTEKSQS